MREIRNAAEPLISASPKLSAKQKRFMRASDRAIRAGTTWEGPAGGQTYEDAPEMKVFDGNSVKQTASGKYIEITVRVPLFAQAVEKVIRETTPTPKRRRTK